MKFHWSLFGWSAQQRIWPFSIKLCHLLKLSYFALSIWQLLLYFCVEKYGMYFYYLLSLCSYKERQACVCVHLYTDTHTWMFIHTVTHTQINVVGKLLPLFPIINYALVHPRLQLRWMGRASLKNWATASKFVSMYQKAPKSAKQNPTKHRYQTWIHLGTKHLQAEIIYICPIERSLPHAPLD